MMPKSYRLDEFLPTSHVNDYRITQVKRRRAMKPIDTAEKDAV